MGKCKESTVTETQARLKSTVLGKRHHSEEKKLEF